MMKRVLFIASFGLQSAVALVILFCVYMIFALLDYQGGIEGIVGTTFIQPILGIIFSIITIIICSIIGLPIRLNSRIRTWWINHFYISLFGIFLAVVLIILSIIPNFQQTIQFQNEEQIIPKNIPNLVLISIGWFLLAFSLTHFYLPKFLFNKLKISSEKIIHKFRNSFSV